MYIIETLTNMHVGSGDTHFGVVDNLIQRNPVTKVPVIHSSGIKGALLDYFEQDEEFKKENKIKNLFGGKMDTETDEKEKKLSFLPGHLIFFEASLITLPLRSNYKVFYNCTSISVIRSYLSQLKTFAKSNEEINTLDNWFGALTFEGKDFLYFDDEAGKEIEDFTAGRKYTNSMIDVIKKLLDKYTKINLDHLSVFDDTIFARICERSIPVVARNQIKSDGTSGNLFYEEVLPRNTYLYCLIGGDKFITDSGEAKKFFDEVAKAGRIFQFGGNFSIGYGFSKIHPIAC
jgi:CRISPR-associated protein Cmr4